MSYGYSAYGQPQPSGSSSLDPNLAFYSGGTQPNFYAGQPAHESSSRGDISGAIGGGPSGSSGPAGGASYGGPIVVQNWWNAFTPWTGMEGEPPLLEGALSGSAHVLDLIGADGHHFVHTRRAELGINFDHILQKSLTVLNPLRSVDPHIMDDADLAGPLVFCFVFASFLLLVRRCCP